MAVDWSIADPSKTGYDALASLRQIGDMALQRIQGQAQQQQTQRSAFDLSQDQARAAARPGIAAAAAGGNYTGAAQQALATGDTTSFAGVQNLHQAHLDQLDREAGALGDAAYTLSQVKDPVQRQQAFAKMIPGLKAQGFSDQELGAADLSDAGLQGYITHAIGAKQAVQDEFERRRSTQADQQIALRGQELGLDERKFAYEQHKPEAVGFGSTLVDPSTGRVVYGGGGDSADTGTKRGLGWTPTGAGNKASLIAQKAGVGVDTPLTMQQFVNLDMTQNEGRAAAPNNPGNMKNTDGSWRSFVSLADYQQAQKAWLQRRWNEGSRTVNDAVQGRAIGGGSGSGAGGMSAAAIDLAAREGLAHGGVVPAGYSRNRAAQAAITNRMAELNGGGDVGSLVQAGQTTKSQGNAYQTWNSGRPNTGGVVVRNLNVATTHLDQAGQAMAALQNGDVPLFNRLSQALAQQTGRAAPTNFNAIKGFVTDEVVKGVLGNAGGVHDRAQELIANWNSPAQSAGVIAQLQKLMGGQLSGLRQQYKQSTGRDDFEGYVSPRARQFLEGGSGSRQPPSGATRTASGPNGQKVALVGGKWVPY